MSQPPTPQPALIRVRKYPNRRLYDATRSRDLTMTELYEHIAAGGQAEITDSRTGDDITNAVLIQLILERDVRKLDIFPSAILHQVIRTQHQFLGGVVEQFFRQAIEAQRSTQEQWSQFLQRTLGSSSASALDPLGWSRSMLGALGAAPSPAGGAASDATPPASDDDSELDSLRREVAELRARSSRKPRAAARKPAARAKRRK